MVPYIALDTELTPEILRKGSFTGTVLSNYPIRFVYINLYGNDGELVKSVVFNGEFDSRKVNLRNYAAKLFSNDVNSGEYTLELVAGISRDSAELARVDFTYSK